MESVKESRTFLRNSNFKKEVYGLKQLALLDTNSFNHAYSLVNSLPDYAETPLIQMPRLSELLDIGSLYCKYEGDRFGGSSFKSLGLSSAVIVAVERILTSTYELKVEIADLIAGKYKIETSSITFAAATSGNHGYALAWISSQLGAKCKIYCATDVSKNRIARIESMGAEVISVEGSFDRAVELCNEQSQLHGDIVISNVVQEGFEDVPKLIMNGYGIIAKEISIQLGDAFPTHIFVGGGGDAADKKGVVFGVVLGAAGAAGGSVELDTGDVFEGVAKIEGADVAHERGREHLDVHGKIFDGRVVTRAGGGVGGAVFVVALGGDLEDVEFDHLLGAGAGGGARRGGGDLGWEGWRGSEQRNEGRQEETGRFHGWAGGRKRGDRRGETEDKLQETVR